MTLEEAIEILTMAIGQRYLPPHKDLDDATKMGIEAIKVWKQVREGGWPSDGILLPGETPE